MNQNIDLFTTVIPQVSIRLVQEQMLPGPIISGPEAAADVACQFLRDKDREYFIAIFLSSSARVTGLSVCHIGSINSSIVRIADSFKAALLANAASVIFSHNHPSGNPEPSAEDIAVTRKLVEAGQLMDIPVRDHIIVTPDGSFTSFARKGLL